MCRPEATGTKRQQVPYTCHVLIEWGMDLGMVLRRLRLSETSGLTPWIWHWFQIVDQSTFAAVRSPCLTEEQDILSRCQDLLGTKPAVGGLIRGNDPVPVRALCAQGAGT